MKDTKGRALKKARIVVWADDGMKDMGTADFSRRPGKKEVEAADLARLGTAAAGAKSDDEAFFACLDAAREVGAEIPNWEPKPASRFAAERGGTLDFADMRKGGERPFRSDGAVALANAKTKRAAIMTENADGTFDGHVLEPGESCAVVDGRVIGREPFVKGKRTADGRVTLPVPYVRPFEWRDADGGEANPGSEASFVEATALFLSEAVFPLVFSAGDGTPRKPQARALDGETYARSEREFAAAWSREAERTSTGCAIYDRDEAKRAAAAKAAAAAGRALDVVGNGEEGEKAAADAKARWDGAVFFEGREWKRSPAPKFVVVMDRAGADAKIRMSVSFDGPDDVARESGRHEKYAAFPATEHAAAVAKAVEWAETYEVPKWKTFVVPRPETADPACVGRRPTAEATGLDEATAAALGLDGLAFHDAVGIATWALGALGRGKTRFEAYGTLSGLERAWLAKGRDEKSLFAAISRGEVFVSEGAAKAYAAFDA